MIIADAMIIDHQRSMIMTWGYEHWSLWSLIMLIHAWMCCSYYDRLLIMGDDMLIIAMNRTVIIHDQRHIHVIMNIIVNPTGGDEEIQTTHLPEGERGWHSREEKQKWKWTRRNQETPRAKMKGHEWSRDDHNECEMDWHQNCVLCVWIYKLVKFNLLLKITWQKT